MTETDEALVEIMLRGSGDKHVKPLPMRDKLRNGLAALRAAGYTIAPPGAVVIPTEGPEFDAAVDRALVAHWQAEAPDRPLPNHWYTEERDPMAAALRAAGGR